jgi:hypothetical protein
MTAIELRMSFFEKPITNKKPQRTVTLLQVYQAIRGHYYKDVISQLRAITDKETQRRFKGKHLDYITPSGVFTYDSDGSLVSHSGILCMDLDDFEDREALKQQLIDDKNFTTLLLFRSPCGRGLKWFIAIDIGVCSHKTWFASVRNYLMATYGLTDKQVDKSCSNVSRACYLSYDPDAYINNEFLIQNNIDENGK